MNRRDFLKAGAAGAMLGAAVTQPAAATPAPPEPSIIMTATAEDHRRRLQNIAFCRQTVRICLREHLVTDYLAGQACYNLGEYPCRQPWDPDDYDERELDRLRDHGIQLVHVFDEWNDSIRLFGGDKYTALNPAGFRRFVDMVHARGMKVIAYVSTGFLQRADPDLRREWWREGDFLQVGYFDMARCQPSSAGWRAFLLPRILRVLDEYGVDGVYNDCGYMTNAAGKIGAPTPDETDAFEESSDFDGAFTDLLSLLYSEVKRRGGILKLHVNAADRPPSRDVKVYDYLWVGEGVADVDMLRERVKHFPPYVVPCIDENFAKIEREEDAFLHAVPFMQFPVLPAGRPLTGERGMIPGVAYTSTDDFWMRRCRAAWQQYQAHPDGPYTYSQWDALPARPETQPTHKRWLQRYRAMTEEGTRAWLEVGDSDLFAEPLPKDAVASVFANRETYLVLANYGRAPIEVATRHEYAPFDDAATASPTRFEVGTRSLRLLRKVEGTKA